MNNLLIHPRTRLQIESIIASAPHAILLTGPLGIGKGTIASNLAEQLLKIDEGKLVNYPFLRTLEGKTAGIEGVRSLDEFLSLKVPGKDGVNRVVIIDSADQLAHEAQNALLKTLEEPPKGTVLILTASYAEGLLPTIRSRVQTISLQIPASQEIKNYFLADYDETKVTQAQAMTGGLPGLMTAILKDEDHPLLTAVEQAKNYVRGTTFDRLVQSDKLAKDRSLTEQTLYVLQQMAHISLQSAEGGSAKRWQQILESSYNASKSLNQNAQLKLVLTNLALSF